jgi:hypothetical protein
MNYDVNNTRFRSPLGNYSKGRAKPIQIIVVHATASDTLESAANWLCNPHSEVSTNYIIDEFGNIFCLVDDNDTAYHAGKSKWGELETHYKDGTTSINDCSLGIELVNTNSGKDPYEPTQLAALTWLVEWKAHQYSVSLDNIVRHLDVAPGRKTDPAGFPWATWRKSLTVGSDEGIWALWGNVVPLYPDARHFGIPQAWFKKAALLGEARSNPLYEDDLVIQVFQHGVVLYRDGKSRIVLDTEIGL